MAILLSVGVLCWSAPFGFAVRPDPVAVSVMGAAVLLVCLGAVFLWNRTLKIRVEQKTAELEAKAAEIRELNEQLRISNEELQTSNEEYESANEELQLLNDDLNERNVRLAEATEQMRALKDFNEKVIAAVPSVLLVVDRHMKILSANNRYYVAFPKVSEKAEGAFLLDALPHHLLYEHDIIRKIEQTVQSCAPVRFPEVCYVNDQNVEHFFDVYVCPVASAPVSGEQASNVLLVIDDVTETKRLQNEIRSRERYLSNLVNNSIVSIMATDSEANFTFFNEGAEKLLGVSSREMCGTPARHVFSHEPDFRKILDRARSGERVEDCETEFINHRREKTQVSLFATGLRNEKGELVGYLIVGVDIRERKRAEQNLIRRNKELSTLYSVGNTLSSSETIEERLRQAAKQILGALGGDVCAMAVCSPDNALEVQNTYSAGEQNLPNPDAINRVCEIVTRRVLHQQKPVFGGSFLEDPELCKVVTEAHADGSFISVPLSAAAKILGSLTVIKMEQPRFGPEDVDLLSSLGQRIAVAMENEKLYAAQKENVFLLRALLKATRVIGSVLDADGVMEALASEAMEIAACRHAVVLSRSSEKEKFSIAASKSAGERPALKKGMFFPAGRGPIENLFEGVQHCVSSAADEKKCPLKEALLQAGASSCLCLPMVSDGFFGVLALGQDDHRRFSDTAVHILSDLLAHASLSIKNARLYTELQTAYAPT